MRARTDLWEPWGGNAPGPPGPVRTPRTRIGTEEGACSRESYLPLPAELILTRAGRRNAQLASVCPASCSFSFLELRSVDVSVACLLLARE